MTIATTRSTSWSEERASAHREQARLLAAAVMLFGILAVAGTALAAVVAL